MKTVIEMAREAGLITNSFGDVHGDIYHLERFAAQVREDERNRISDEAKHIIKRAEARGAAIEREKQQVVSSKMEHTTQEPVALMSLLKEARDTCKAAIVEDGISSMRKEYRIDLERRLTAYINTTPPTSQQEPVAWYGLVMEAAAELELASYAIQQDSDSKRSALNAATWVREQAKKLRSANPQTAALAARQMRDAAVNTCKHNGHRQDGQDDAYARGYRDGAYDCEHKIAALPVQEVPLPKTLEGGYELCEDEGCPHRGTVHYCRSVPEFKWRDLTDDDRNEIETKVCPHIDSHDFETIGNAYIAAFKEKNK